MKLFTRKSRWDRLLGAAAATMENGELRRLTKVTLSIVGGAVAATAASAAVSSIRHQDET
jgi:uncharacterized protein (DUF697 family)